MARRSPIGIVIEGTEKVRAQLKRGEINGIRLLDNAINDAGFILLGEVVASARGQRGETASVDTGAFSTVGRGMQINNSTFLESKVFNIMEYAVFLEEGTSRIVPRRHFEASLERNRKRLVDFIARKIKII